MFFCFFLLLFFIFSQDFKSTNHPFGLLVSHLLKKKNLCNVDVFVSGNFIKFISVKTIKQEKTKKNEDIKVCPDSTQMLLLFL